MYDGCIWFLSPYFGFIPQYSTVSLIDGHIEIDMIFIDIYVYIYYTIIQIYTVNILS